MEERNWGGDDKFWRVEQQKKISLVVSNRLVPFELALAAQAVMVPLSSSTQKLTRLRLSNHSLPRATAKHSPHNHPLHDSSLSPGRGVRISSGGKAAEAWR